MTYMEQMIQLWESQTGDIQIILSKIIDLLRKAKIENEKIALQFELDILLQANYTYGFGTEPEDAKMVINLFNSLDEKNYDKLNRFLALTCSVVISSLSYDEQNNTQHTNAILKPLGVINNATKINAIRTFLSSIQSYLTMSLIDKWYYECVSFILTFLGILQELNSWTKDEDNFFESIQNNMSKEMSVVNRDLLDIWKGEWIEKNDFFRFSALLITGKFAAEELWLQMARKVIGIE